MSKLADTKHNENCYDDIIGLPHPEPRSHPRMSLYNRAAQFSSFAALTGYDEAGSSRKYDLIRSKNNGILL